MITVKKCEVGSCLNSFWNIMFRKILLILIAEILNNIGKGKGYLYLAISFIMCT